MATFDEDTKLSCVYSEIATGELTREKYRNMEDYREIDWTIEDIFSYTEEGTSYNSPLFFVSGSQWTIVMRPNGDRQECSVGWISLFLYRIDDEDSEPLKSVNFSLGVRKADGTVDMIAEDISWVFDEPFSISREYFLERSKVSERKSELAPSDVLTVTCTLRVNESWNFASSLIELSTDLKTMFTSKIGCDATLKVQDEEFPVHKSILVSRSTVFEAMFQAEMKENNTGVVDIVDCDPAAFKDFLVFIYSGRFEKSSGDIFELYKIAHKYCVERLKAACVILITRDISVDNVIVVAILGRQCHEWKLIDKSQEFFDENVKDILPTDKWNSLLLEDPTLANELLKNMTKNVKIRKSSARV